jgi:hypothetical protein
MKELLAFLRVAVVGFAVLAGGRALYRNRDKLKRDWTSFGGFEGVKGLTDNLNVGKLLGSAGSFKNLASQFTRQK